MSGSSKPQPEREYVETGGEPGYFVSEIRTETVGGNITVYAYQLRHGKDLHLLFTATVSAKDLATMARQAMEAAADAHNVEEWKLGGDTSH